MADERELNGTEDQEQLEKMLAEAEAKLEVSEASLSEEDAATDVAAQAVKLAEEGKDSPVSLSQQVTQKYLSMGRQLLSDPGAGNTLDGEVRRRVTRILGQDPGDVRIHTGERAAGAADALGARAFAVGGGDVFFGRGQFTPDTREGFGVLVHELAHTTDAAVGAAFSTEHGRGSYSAAEERAEAAERFAIHDGGKSADPDGEMGHEAGEGKGDDEDEVDLDKLESAVAKLLNRNQHKAADRTGSSATIGPDGT